MENLQIINNESISANRNRILSTLPNIRSMQSPTKLSFGQRRLLELLRIKHSFPFRIVLMDEPLAGLDPDSI